MRGYAQERLTPRAGDARVAFRKFPVYRIRHARVRSGNSDATLLERSGKTQESPCA
jgi:hypothetical protein